MKGSRRMVLDTRQGWGRLLMAAARRKDGKVLHELRGAARVVTANKLLSLGLIRYTGGDWRRELGEITELGRLCVSRGYVEV